MSTAKNVVLKQKVFEMYYLCMNRAVYLSYNVSDLRAHEILFITVIGAAMLRSN